MSCLTELTGNEGWTDRMNGCHMIIVTGARSLAVSNASFGYTLGFIANVLETSSIV